MNPKNFRIIINQIITCITFIKVIKMLRPLLNPFLLVFSRDMSTVAARRLEGKVAVVTASTEG